MWAKLASRKGTKRDERWDLLPVNPTILLRPGYTSCKFSIIIPLGTWAALSFFLLWNQMTPCFEHQPAVSSVRHEKPLCKSSWWWQGRGHRKYLRNLCYNLHGCTLARQSERLKFYCYTIYTGERTVLGKFFVSLDNRCHCSSSIDWLLSSRQLLFCHFLPCLMSAIQTLGYLAFIIFLKPGSLGLIIFELTALSTLLSLWMTGLAWVAASE